MDEHNDDSLKWLLLAVVLVIMGLAIALAPQIQKMLGGGS